ncbi:hypothetical protein JTB14_016534 [Gonioctena quinquepunctata]|nr:hypothetical protein JTB14_016534 [Gonioctena quinquepunctata]
MVRSTRGKGRGLKSRKSIAPSNDILAPDDETLQLSSSLLNQDTEKARCPAEPEIETFSENAEIHISQVLDELATMTPNSLGSNGAHQRNEMNVEQSTPKPSTSGTQSVVSPEVVRPYSKASPRKTAIKMGSVVTIVHKL